MQKTVLVTGGSGFIGSHVVDYLAAAGYRPRIFDTRPSPWHDDHEVDTVIGDLLNPDAVRRAMRGCDAVCHLAAAADVGEVQAHPGWATELNSGGTLNVLEAARDLGVTRVVYASTVWVYSDVVADEVDEDTPLAHPAHLYTAGKLAGELYCRSYAELYGIEPTVLRFGIPYGPRARPAAVIPSFVDRARRGESITIAGTGEQERSFVYVEDLADGVVKALETAAIGRTYNLAGRETTTIRELAEIVRDEVAETPIVHTEGRAGDLRGATIHSDRAEQELGWVASTPLREGVRRYAEWVDEQPAPEAAALEVAGAHDRLSRVRNSARDLSRQPFAVGVAASIAVFSAAVSVMLGTTAESQAVDFAFIAIAILAPLWALTNVVWPAERRRLQTSMSLILGVFGVLLLGLLSTGSGEGGLHTRPIALALVVSVGLTISVKSARWRHSDEVLTSLDREPPPRR